jgi:ketosteroid isomerase-like protein
MSEENVEIVRRLYRAVEAWDTAAFADLTHPGLEWVSDE